MENNKVDIGELIVIFILASMMIILMALSSCKSRRIDHGIYKVKYQGKWYITDQKRRKFKP